MAKLFGVAEVVLPVITALLLGRFARVYGIISEKGMEEMKNLLVKICLPAVLFSAFCDMTFTGREAALFFVFSGFTLTAFLLGHAAARLLGLRQGIAPWLMTTIEGGSIGYALFLLLYGQENLYHLALLDAGNALIQWTVVMSLLSLRSGAKSGLGETAQRLITPVNAAILMGFICSVTGIGRLLTGSAPGRAVMAAVDFMGTPVSALIILSVGYSFSLKGIDLKEAGKTAAARACIFAVLGLIAARLAGRLFPDDGMYRSAALIFAILPPTFAYGIYVKEGEESEYLSGFLALYTLLTVAVFAAAAFFLR